MKRHVWLSVILFILMTACSDTFIYQRSLSQFSERFAKANSDEDMDAMLSLYATGGLEETDITNKQNLPDPLSPFAVLKTIKIKK